MNPIYSSDSINNNPAIIKQNILSRSIISQNSHIDLDSQKNEVELLSKIKSNQSEDHTEKIKITLINSNTKNPKIQIQITNPTDPLILYMLDITEVEFMQIKSEQSLLIDFQNFSNFILNMLDICTKENSNYLCVLHKLNLNEALFIIQERTQYRELNHLVLKLNQANDSILKKFLGNLYIEFRTKYEDAINNINNLDGNVQEMTKEMNEIKEELNQNKTENKNNLDNLLNEKNKEINLIKEQCFAEQKKSLENLENEKNKKISELENKIKELQNNIENLSKTKIELEDYKMKLEINQKDLEGKHAISNTELNVYKNDIQKLREDNSNLNQQCFKQEKEITELQFKNQNYLNEIEEKKKKTSKI